MSGFSTRKAMALGLTLGAVSVSASFAACSSSSSPGGSSGAAPAAGDDSGGGGSSVSSTPGSCTNPTIAIDFAPMYSAFIPGSTTHTFQIPAVTDEAATWSVDDPTMVQLAPQTFNNQPGVMITLQGIGTGGKVTVFATTATGACGSSVLNITSNIEDDWQVGSSRYNDGVNLHLGPPAGFDGGGFNRPEGGVRPDGGFGPKRDGGSFFEVDGGTACTNCHGPTAASGPYKDVAHTPEQTGGFSDPELINIILHGQVPDGGYFDPTVIDGRCEGGAECTARAYQQWSSFHQWSDITEDQYAGIIVYLRSLQPVDQGGTANFGGKRRDGGKP